VADVDLAKFFDRVNHDVLLVVWEGCSGTNALPPIPSALGRAR
jgi:retron-type reverse transcriptase